MDLGLPMLDPEVLALHRDLELRMRILDIPDFPNANLILMQIAFHYSYL